MVEKVLTNGTYEYPYGCLKLKIKENENAEFMKEFDFYISNEQFENINNFDSYEDQQDFLRNILNNNDYSTTEKSEHTKIDKKERVFKNTTKKDKCNYDFGPLNIIVSNKQYKSPPEEFVKVN